MSYSSSSVVNFKKKIGFVFDAEKHYDKIAIGSVYWECKIEAKTVEVAISKFKSLEF